MSVSAVLKPHALAPDPETIPQELRSLAQWVVWRYSPNDNRDAWTKTPLQAKAAVDEKALNASSTRPQTWADFSTAWNGYTVNLPSAGDIPIPADKKNDPGHNGIDGVGFNLTPDNGITGVDLDHCLDAEGNPVLWAVPILERFKGTYTEVSPSGTGLRIFCYAQKPSLEHSKVGDVEMYDGRSKNGKQGGRYLTLTGHSYGEPEPITEKRDAVTWLYDEYLVKPKAKKQEPRKTGTGNVSTPPVSDGDLLEKIFASAKGGELKTLWDGDSSAHAKDNNDGESEGDLALAGALAWWCNYDLARADALFRQSNRMRAKWDELRGSETWGQRTLKLASEGKGPGDGYTPDDGRITVEKSAEPETPWEPLQALPGLYPPVPELPAELIPDPLRPWLSDIAERASLPLEFVTCPALVALSTVIGRSVGIYPKRRDDWLVVPNLWGGIVGKPGVMKSAAISEPTKPLRALANRAREAFQETQGDADAERSRLELEVSVLKEQAKKEAKKGGISADFQTALRDLTGQLANASVTERRYLTQDATVEKLGELLQENPNGLLVLRDELAGWLCTLERPGREGEREFYLEAWDGTGGFTFDRIGRGTVHIDALTVSMLGAIQPGKLDKYLSEAIAGGGGADGLLQRFQLVVYPDRVGDYKHVDRYPDSAAKQKANAIFETLDSLDLNQLGLDTQEGEIPALHFSDDAQDLFDLWRTELEQRLRSPDLDPKPAFASHISKYRSLMPSLALIFHLVGIADGTANGPVSLEAAQLAAAWCEYLEAHALKLYAPEVSSHIKAAQELKAKLEDGAVKDGGTIRDIYNAGWAGLTDRATVLSGLEVLAECNWVRIEEQVTGGRPSQTVRIHPDLRGGAK